MAHNIYGERIAVRGNPAWHSLGIVFGEDDKISVKDGFKLGGVDYDVQKILVPDFSAFGKVISSGQYALVRGPSGADGAEFLAFVSPDYEVVTGLEVAEILEPLVGEWPLETVGALGKGERFFVTLKVGETVLNGSDRITRYFLVSGNHGNGKGINIAVVTVRVVCENTLEMALGNASVVSFSHGAGVRGDLAVATSVIAKLHKADDLTVKTLERLALARVTDDQVEQIIRAAYPDPTEPKKARFAREARENGQIDAAEHFKVSTDNYNQYLRETENNRQLARVAYKNINEEFDDIARTAWAALNAVTEVSNHREGRGNVDESVVFGTRRLEGVRALTEANRIVEKVLA